MSYLFVDSTYDITLGLLDDDLKWVDFKTHSEKKASTILQSETYNLFQSHGLKVKNIKALFTVAGPGFYTGLRLSEGLADVYKFFNIPHYSFYSYDIPLWLGQESGTWVTKAYRGEYFFHEWSSKGSRDFLVSMKELPELKSSFPDLFIHSTSSLDALSIQYIENAISTLELLKKSPGKIFNKILNDKSFKESFYFRAPEDEFRVNP